MEQKYYYCCRNGSSPSRCGGQSNSVTVIGVPIAGSNLDGMDALLSIVQMPSGIPVATVAINGSKNAAYLALQIMAY